ncbi:MAG: hypothetical protein M1840_001211 [Geoglossum simile]|nr:MAG: hypothetical protein M1840_001211 [Geoglossum simile]
MVPISDLIKAIDTALRLRKSIKNAAGEFQCLSERLEFSSKTLSQVEKIKVNLTGKTNYEEIPLDEACSRYQNTLGELRSHLENYSAFFRKDQALSWYKGRSSLRCIEVSKIAVERGNHGNIRKLLIENSLDGYTYHTCSGEIFQSPFMEHRQQFKEIQQLDPTVRYVVSFSGNQKVSKCNNVGASEWVISSRAFEYSFVDRGGMYSTIPNLPTELAAGEMKSPYEFF